MIEQPKLVCLKKIALDIADLKETKSKLLNTIPIG